MSLAEQVDGYSIARLYELGSHKWTVPPEGVIGSFVAEMDFGTAEPIMAAMREELAKESFGYLPPAMIEAFRDAVAAWHRERYSWTSVDPSDVRSVPEVIRGFELAISYFSPPGSPIIVPTPAYRPFLALPPLLGRDVIEVPMLNSDGYYRMDLDAIARAFSAGGHLLVLCNPHNPTGRVFERTELDALARVVAQHGGRVFSDEIHSPLVYAGGQRHLPYASIDEVTAAHTLTSTSGTKAWNLPGLKSAAMILSNDRDRERWAEIETLSEYSASNLGVVANTAAFRSGGPWLDEALAYLDGNRQLLAELLAERLPDVVYRPPDGTYLAWLDFRAMRLQPGAARFVNEHSGVRVHDGDVFGAAGRDFVRLTLATPRHILAETVDRIAKTVRAAGAR